MIEDSKTNSENAMDASKIVCTAIVVGITLMTVGLVKQFKYFKKDQAMVERVLAEAGYEDVVARIVTSDCFTFVGKKNKYGVLYWREGTVCNGVVKERRT